MDLDKNMIIMHIISSNVLAWLWYSIFVNTCSVEWTYVNTTYFDIKTIITKRFPKLRKVPLHVITSYKLHHCPSQFEFISVKLEYCSTST